MSLMVRLAESDRDRAAVFRLRHGVHVDELGANCASTNAGSDLLHDDLDDHARIYLLLDGEELAGTFRVARLADMSRARFEELVTRCNLARAIDHFLPEELLHLSRLIVLPRYRKGSGLLQMLSEAYRDGCAWGGRLAIGTCSPNLVTLYEMLGYRRFTDPYNDPTYGLRIPIMIPLRDHAWARDCNSPFAEIATGFPDDRGAREWMVEAYPASSTAPSAPILGIDGFLALTGESARGDAAACARLLRGLPQARIGELLARSTIIHAKAGDRVIQRGHGDRTLFLVLGGTLVAQGAGLSPIGDRAIEAGETLGEASFLGDGVRACDVVATDSVQLLVIPGDWLSRYLRDNPDAGSLLMRNLAQELSVRASGLVLAA